MVARVLIGLGHHPCRSVRDAEVEDLAGCDDVVEGLHQLGNGSRELPPVDVEQVDVVSLKLLERIGQRSVEGLGMVAGEVDLVLDRLVRGLVASSELFG